MRWLRKTCPVGNLHWRWDDVCHCCIELDAKGRPLGQLFDFNLNAFFVLVPSDEEIAAVADFEEELDLLTTDELELVDSWRDYKAEMLAPFGDSHSFRVEISVDLNGMRDVILTIGQGLSLANVDDKKEPN